MAEPFQPLEVLAERFAARCDAIEARVIGPLEDNRLATLVVFEREGTPTGTPDRERRWQELAADNLADQRIQLTSGRDGLPDVVVAVPIDGPTGAAAVLCGGFDAEALTKTTSILWTARSFAYTMSLCLDDPSGFGRMIGATTIDPLTRCGSALSMWESLEREINRASRQRTPLACTFIDLDGFKQVNENGGHLSGDVVLAAVGAALSACVRGYDTVSRFGGDEFVVIMPNSTEKQARALVARMARQVVAATTPLAATPVTASFGTAQLRFDEPAAALLERADRCMLENKRARRGELVQ